MILGIYLAGARSKFKSITFKLSNFVVVAAQDLHVSVARHAPYPNIQSNEQHGGEDFGTEKKKHICLGT